MNEAQTRKEYIDKALKKANWSPQGSNKYQEEFEMERVWGKGGVAEPQAPYGSEHEFADYVLLDRHEQPLAIVEVKRTSKNARIGQQQAIGYANNIKAKYGIDPFIFLSNGEDILFLDRERYPTRLVHGFFERRDLERLLFQRKESLENLSEIKINPEVADRDYQAEAIRTVVSGIQNSHRKFLLVMATGTGKTRTSMAIIDCLLRAKRINTVLFLTDRKVLRDQAYGKKGYQGFFTESCGKITSGRFNPEKRLYAATIQTMMECYKDISPGFFDLVIADECHRSIYNKWKDVLSYFDSIQIGLTATPAEFIERDTFRYFDVNLKDKIKGNFFNYSYDKAIEEKHLLPFVPYHAKTSFQIKGLREDEIPAAVRKKLVEEGKTLDELNFEGTEFEKRFTNTGTHEAMVREFMEVCYKDDTGTLPGKTIIFAMTKNHAYRLLDAFDRLYPQYKGRLAEVIVSEDSRADNFLGRFENDSYPRIAISVDMLDTGVDIREVTNLVFAKPVFSKIKFWQMIGRGTRTLDKNNMKTWCPHKENFLIIDHWNNFEYFGEKPEGELPSMEDALPSRVFKAKVNRLRAYINIPDKVQVELIAKELQAMIEKLPKDSISIKEKKDILKRVQSAEFWKNIDTQYLYDFAAPLMRFLEDINYNEYSFILKCEKLELALLAKDDRKILESKEDIRSDLRLLPMNLQVVKRHEKEVFKVASDAFWGELTVDNIREAKKTLAPVMRYKRKDTQEQPIQFDLDDQIIERKWIEFGPHGEGEYVHVYKEKVEKRVKDLAEKEQAIIKIKNDQPVNDEDLEALENTLNSPELYITEDKLREAYSQPQGTLVQFIKSIFGKYKFKSQEDQIAESFDGYIIAHNYNTDQTRFLRVIKNVFLAKVRRHEFLEIDDFYEGPVEAFGTGAADRLFSKKDLTEVLEFFNERVQIK